MEAKQVKTAEDARKLIEERQIRYVKVGVFDVDGIMRGKYMHKDKFLSALDGGFGFCDVVLGWDSNDQLYDSAKFTGWHTAYPDAPVRLLPDTCRELPMEEDTVLFLGEFEGEAENVCPRAVLRRVLNKVADMGYRATAACEFEFFLFEETPHSVREKGYRDLKNITPGFYGYSMLRSSVHAEFYRDLLDLGEAMDFPIEGLHTETGPGVLEAAIAHDDALRAADKAALFKTFTKVLAQRSDWMATFMAKWSPDWPGQSGHMHTSLFDIETGKSVFFDEGKDHNMSDQMRWFVGGQQKLMPELLSMVACTVNSYSRLIPGFWAPTHATWGVENRTTALRVIPGSSKSQRVEYRIAAADINPYIALAACIGSGLWGIENKIEPTAPVTGNAYEQEFPAELTIPATLYEAAGRLRKSDAANSLFGEKFVEHYAQSREWEEREFRKAITDWEMQRYFEII
ncbi:glutamine synthetase family protein [Thalassospira sp. TSL5-1]|uniref:glutamine synthetase family protein n=1 Tax=Thalassospira sp. TSL5-1 TaxID=1544451 RepID=UPI00093B7373|nr:glutamine synthetase family protein [Thalassospira sp. TSL5-1]OKH89795.1 glutamine synthetase [Thalassospira sp. TSL5-1]